MGTNECNFSADYLLGFWLLGPIGTTFVTLLLTILCFWRIKKNLLHLEPSTLGWKSFESLKKNKTCLKFLVTKQRKSHALQQTECLRNDERYELVSLFDGIMKKTKLLHKIIPIPTANELLGSFNVQPQVFESVTLLFTNISNFPHITETISPSEIFDTVIEKYSAYKVETVKDTYFVASGLNSPKSSHTVESALMALDLIKSVTNITICKTSEFRILLRIGMHLGPVAAGVIGIDKPRYCLFGDTVNMTSRLSTTGEPLKIHLSSECYLALVGSKRFVMEERGLTFIKGKGLTQTYWLTGCIPKTAC